MIRVLRVILGMGCLVAGVVASGSLYAAADGSADVSTGLQMTMDISAALSFGCFGLFRVLLPSEAHRLVLGTVGSYLLLLATLLVVSWLQGELAQTQMWLPIIILFGIPYLAPLVLLSGLANYLIWPWARDGYRSD